MDTSGRLWRRRQTESLHDLCQYGRVYSWQAGLDMWDTWWDWRRWTSMDTTCLEVGCPSCRPGAGPSLVGLLLLLLLGLLSCPGLRRPRGHDIKMSK